MYLFTCKAFLSAHFQIIYNILDALYLDISQNLFVDHLSSSNMVMSIRLLTYTIIVMIYVQISCIYISAPFHPVLCPDDPRPAHGGPLSPLVWVGERASYLLCVLGWPRFSLGTLGACVVAASVGFICMTPLQCDWQWMGAVQILPWRSYWVSVHGSYLQSVCLLFSCYEWLPWGRLRECSYCIWSSIPLCVALAFSLSLPFLCNVTIGFIIAPVSGRGVVRSSRCVQ